MKREERKGRTDPGPAEKGASGGGYRYGRNPSPLPPLPRHCPSILSHTEEDLSYRKRSHRSGSGQGFPGVMGGLSDVYDFEF